MPASRRSLARNFGRGATLLLVWWFVGALLSLAIAWAVQRREFGCAPPNPPMHRTFDPVLRQSWGVWRGSGWTHSESGGRGSASRPLNAYQGYQIVKHPPCWAVNLARTQFQEVFTGVEPAVAVQSYGWPWRCVSTIYLTVIDEVHFDIPIKYERTEWWRGVKLFTSGLNEYRLAVVPEAGLFACSAMYGALAYAIARVIGRFRQLLRHRAGLCVRCRYDIRGLALGAVCPECGHLSKPASAGFPRSG